MHVGQVKLICRAKGVPQPRVNWRREDGKDIIIRESVSVSNGQKSKSELDNIELNIKIIRINYEIKKIYKIMNRKFFFIILNNDLWLNI